MLSIGKLIATQAAYYTEQLTHSIGEDVPVIGPDGSNQTDYYTAHQAPSRWLGSGLDRLGLTQGSPVDSDDFAKLMNHKTPSGEAMIVPHAHHLNVAAFDLTLSAPKSVSLLYSFGNEQVRQEVVGAHREAVHEALGYMEAHASQTRLVERRRDSDGSKKMNTRSVPSEGFVAAGFDHYTSRAQDPQLHTHVVAINRVYADDGWRAIDGRRVYAHAKAGGTIYEAKLREGLTRRLGVSWGPVTNGIADIEGFSPELIRHFSTRRTEILAAVERRLAQHGGVAHRKMTQAFTLETRQAKVYPKDESPLTRRMKNYGVSGTVESHWYQKAIDAPQDIISLVEQVVRRGREGLRPTEIQLEQSALTITESLTQKQAVFTERDLISDVAELYPEGASAAELTAAAKLVLDAGQSTGEVITVLPEVRGQITVPHGIELTTAEHALVTAVGPDRITSEGSFRLRALPGEPCFTTRAQLEREAAVLNAVTSTSPVIVDEATLEAGMTARRLVDEQIVAIRHLSRLDGMLVALVGPGGSGKTHAIGAYAEAARASGSLVIGAATSATAAAKLGGDLGDCWSGTVALLRHRLEASKKPLPERTVVVVDEASMVSTVDLAYLVKLTEACDGKLVLIGDPKQLPSVDSGGLFHRIVAEGQQVVDDLAEVNQRQMLDLDRENLQRLRVGEIGDSVRYYSEAGRLHLGKSEYATKAAMVEAWWKDVESQGLEQVRMLASRRDEVEMLNQLARVQMSEAELLTGPVLVNRWSTEFQAGDRVVVRDNWYRHSDLRNGQTGTIDSVDPEKGSVVLRRDLDGQLIDLPKAYADRDLDLAYAQTIHTAQGQTFEVTHLYVDLGVKAEHGYTALSRARGETHLWLTDAPGPLGECSYIHDDPVVENRIEVLVRQLTHSVVEPPAHDQGIAVQLASDRALVELRNRLEETIRQSPIGTNLDDQIAALDIAVEEARNFFHHIGTSGTKVQLQFLEAKRSDLAELQILRQDWLDANVDLINRYSAVSEELQHRLNARLASYSVLPPDDLLAAIGPRLEKGERRHHWDEIASLHAKARLELGPTVDLLDPGLNSHFLYRDAVINFSQPPLSISPALALRPAG